MSIFKKNPNEKAYSGGKKHYADVIKNTGAGELLVWRQPEEDFNDGSTLIVMPGEEAVFIKGGVIEQVFSNGTYVLSTDNYPFVNMDLPTPFKPGDILHVDCRPFAPKTSVVVIDNRVEFDCCYPQCEYVDKNGDKKHGALKHSHIYKEDVVESISPLFNLKWEKK